jgi:hypothetical protein
MGIGGQEDKVLEIINTVPKFEDQIEAIATAQHWCKPGWRWDQDTNTQNHWQTDRTIDSYISGAISVHQAVDQLAIPIEQAYIAALNGEPVTDSADTSGSDTASGLWDLWWGVFHASRKAPWDLSSNQNQLRLVELVQCFQERPDPISPETVLPHVLRNDLIFEDRRLWSNLAMIGPAARGLWDDCPGCGCGCTEPEVQAWLNVNAFAARLTISGTRSFWTYGIRAMRGAVEGRSCRTTGIVDDNGDKIAFREAMVWLEVAGKQMWEKCCEGSDGTAMEEVDVPLDVNVCGKKCPWFGSGTPQLTRARWSYWRRRFEMVSLSKNNEWSEGSKAKALEVAELMKRLEETAGL